jgi:hypothetical protein
MQLSTLFFAAFSLSVVLVESAVVAPCCACTAKIPCPSGPVTADPSKILTCVRGVCVTYNPLTNVVDYNSCGTTSTAAPKTRTTRASVATTPYSGPTITAPQTVPMCGLCNAAAACVSPYKCLEGRCYTFYAATNTIDYAACGVTTPKSDCKICGGTTTSSTTSE